MIFLDQGDKGYEITYKGTRPQDAKDLADYLRRRDFSSTGCCEAGLMEPGVALFYEGRPWPSKKPPSKSRS